MISNALLPAVRRAMCVNMKIAHKNIALRAVRLAIRIWIIIGATVPCAVGLSKKGERP